MDTNGQNVNKQEKYKCTWMDKNLPNINVHEWSFNWMHRVNERKRANRENNSIADDNIT